MRYNKYCILLLVLVFFIFFLLVINPSISEFDYWHMTNAIITEKSGFINTKDIDLEGLATFYILIVYFAMISNVSYDILPSLPLMSLPLIFFLIAILKNMYNEDKKKYYYVLLCLVLIYVTQSSFPRFGLFPHNVGFILFLMILLLSLCLYNRHNRQMISLLMIITVISMNYISYKLTFYIILFIISMSIISEWYYVHHRVDIQRPFAAIALIGIIFTLSFNQFVYHNFLPKITSASEVRSSWGIEKLLSLSNFFRNPGDPLSEYYLSTPLEIKHSYIFWLILIVISLILCTAHIFKKFIKRENFLIGEKVIFGLIISSTLILIVYNALGLADVSFLVFTGIVGYTMIFQFSRNYKRIVLVSILLLLIMNVYSNIEAVRNNFYMGQKDENYFQYINPVSAWYVKHVTNDIRRHTSTDVLTRGYFLKEIATNNISDKYNPGLLSREQVLLLLKPDNSLIEKNPDFRYYDFRFIVNYRESPFFSIGGWDSFNSWSYYKQDIKSNRYIGSIYSSGDVDIILYSKT